MKRCKQKICPECGKEFELDICFRKYCTKECSKKVIKKMNRVRSREYGRRYYGSYDKWIKNLQDIGYHVTHKDEFDRVLQTSIQIMRKKMKERELRVERVVTNS